MFPNIPPTKSQNVHLVVRRSIRALAAALLLCATHTHAQTTTTIGGVVFEDVNGDSMLNDAVPRPNVNVRVYADTTNDLILNTGDTHIADAITGTDGRYTMPVATATNGTRFFVAVDSRSVTPRAEFNAGSTMGDVWAEQTYGDDWTKPTLELGARFAGRDGEMTGASNKSDKYGASPTSFSTLTYRHLAFVDAANGSIMNLDWGFSFNVVTNARAGNADDDDTKANRSVQGSFRQFLQNANAIDGPNALRFVPTVRVVRDNHWAVDVSAPLPALIDDGTQIDGTAYTAADGVSVRDQNPGQIGTGGTVGVDQIALPRVDKQEFEIVNKRSTTVVDVGLLIQGSSTTVRNIAVSGFGSGTGSSGSANIRVESNAANVLVERNLVGTLPSSMADPGDTVRTQGDNLLLRGGQGTVRNNLIGFAAGNGVEITTSSGAWTIERNEIRGNQTNGVVADTFATVQHDLIVDNDEAGVAAFGGSIANNTVRANGRSAGSGSDAGVRLDGANGTVQRNIIADNYGAGVLVQAAATRTLLSQNSISANGTTSDALGNGPSGQIGIDLLQPADDQQHGSVPFVTRNDIDDADAGGNDGRNFAVLQRASIGGGSMTISGFAAPGAQLELFVAAPDASGFGEGQTYLATLQEGSVADADVSTGSYAGTINGVDQGADTTNRFRFTIPTPTGVAVGTQLTATATVDGATSEFSGLVAVDAAPTAITLLHFGATTQAGNVVLEWHAAMERDTAGYRILRSRDQIFAHAVTVSPLLPAQAPSMHGNTYTWTDHAVAPGTYSYWLQEVETGGATQIYGPVPAYVGVWQIFVPVMQ